MSWFYVYVYFCTGVFRGLRRAVVRDRDREIFYPVYLHCYLYFRLLIYIYHVYVDRYIYHVDIYVYSSKVVSV